MSSGVYEHKKGYKQTKEHLKHLGASRRGLKRTGVTKAKMSEAHLGHSNIWRNVSTIAANLAPKTYRERYYNKDGTEKMTMEKKRLQQIRRRAFKKGCVGTHTFGDWELLKKQYGYKCPCCGKTEPDIKLTEDHVIPLSKGGSNFIENIQPLCLPCNIRKHTACTKFEFKGGE
jgi:5-methylcytosine-specific restriction endonuclease McrA